MQIDVSRSLIIIAICALITFGERLLPFLLFRKGNVPEVVKYLGEVLGLAIMTTLVIYLLRGISFSSPADFAPELISLAVTLCLYMWKENMMLSIFAGTACCMFLSQIVFAV